MFQYDNFTSNLENNIKMYYDWALLSIGAWNEVTIPTQQIYGGDYSRLRVVDDPNYNLGQVWETPKQNLVWDTNVVYTNHIGNPINPSNIGIPYIDSAPTSSNYYINYPQGQIVFDNPIPASSTVQLSYPYRIVSVDIADGTPWWKALHSKWWRVDDTQFHQVGSGEWSLFGEHRIQMPSVIIESCFMGSSEGWELGTASRRAKREVRFHIYSESMTERNNLMDIIGLQSDRKIPLFNINGILFDDAFPINYRGEKVNNLNYENFADITGYLMGVCLMEDAQIQNIRKIHPNLYGATVQTTISFIG